MGCATCANLLHARQSERFGVAPICVMQYTFQQADVATKFVLEEHEDSIKDVGELKAVHRLAGVQSLAT
jgi:hypothetical protein